MTSGGLFDRMTPWTTRAALLALGRIGLGAYAVGAFAFFVAAGPTATARAVLANALTDGEQRALTVTVAASLVAALTYVLVIARRASSRGLAPAAAVVACSYEPLVLAPLALWPLYQASTELHVRLFAIVVMAGTFALALHLVATRSARGGLLDGLDPPALGRAGAALTLALALGHAGMVARAGLANVDVLFSGWDLAIYTQVHWNITTTGVPWSTMYSEATWNHYAIHFSPIYHLTALFYALHRSPSTLVVIENIAIGLGALPLYALTRRLTGKASVALLLAVSYVFNPCSIAFGLYDFHEIVFFVPLMLGLAWAVEAEKKRATWVLVVLVLMIREDTPAYLFVYAAYLWLSGKRPIALRIGGVAIFYLVLVHGLVMPALRGGQEYLFDDRYAGLWRAGSRGKGTTIATLLTNPMYALSYVVGVVKKWEFVALVLLPVLALPLASRRALILLVPGFAFSLLSSFGAQYSIDFHYTAPILPFLYIATVVALTRFEPRTRVALASAAALATCLLSAKVGRSPLLNAAQVDAEAAYKAETYADDAPRMHAAAAQIPKSACVRATGNLLPAVAQRRSAYIMPFGRHCDYAFIDYRKEARLGMGNYETERLYLLERLRTSEFGVLYGDTRVLLIGKGLPTERNAEFVARLEAMPEK